MEIKLKVTDHAMWLNKPWTDEEYKERKEFYANRRLKCFNE